MSSAAVPFWRAAGMTYISYSNICANLVRNCLKEPHRSEALSKEKVHYAISKWEDGKPQKPNLGFMDRRDRGLVRVLKWNSGCSKQTKRELGPTG